jgi:catechol 2,3-dioxygenase-like lactoylglutathione lyase family enzyme
MVGTNDPDKARAFYDAAFEALGIQGQHTPKGAFYGSPETGMFGITTPRDEQPATHANGGTIGFLAKSQEEADAWHATGIANGATSCEDPPGVRDNGAVKLYLAYLRDPDGNKICVLHRVA